MSDELDLLKHLQGAQNNNPAPADPPAGDPPSQDPPAYPVGADGPIGRDGTLGDPPAQDPPAGDPAPNIDEIRAQAVAEARASIAKEFFGVDDVTQAAERYKEANAKSEKIAGLFKEKANPFVDDDIKSFNTFVKNTGVKSFDTFKKVTTFNPETADPLDTIVMAKTIKSSKLRGMESDLRASILSKYDVESIDDLKEDKSKYINFLLEVEEASEQIDKFKTLSLSSTDEGDAFDVDAFLSKETESKQAIRSAWEPALTKLFSSKKLTLPAVAGMASGVEVNLSDAEVADFTQTMLNEAVNGGVEASEKGFKEKIYPALMSKLIASKFDSIMSGYISQAVSMTEEERDKYFSRVAKPDAKYNPGEPVKKPVSASESAYKAEFGG